MEKPKKPDSKMYDVVAFPTHHENEDTAEPIENRIEIGNRLWIGRLKRGKGNKIIDACRPRGLDFERVRQFGELYSFVHEKEAVDHTAYWDESNALLNAVVLSRIVHPTSINFEYAAIVFENSDGEIQTIKPTGFSGLGTTAFVAEPQKNYLTEENAEELKILLRKYGNQPEEIQRALWFHEYAARNSDLLIRWSLICSGLEALIHTSSRNSTRQFTVRVPVLADIVGISNISESKVEKMYDFRSKIVHGQTVNEANAEVINLYREMEDILRLAIKQGIVNSDFSKFISNRELIDKEWKIR